jgi:hypothetical protein
VWKSGKSSSCCPATGWGGALLIDFGVIQMSASKMGLRPALQSRRDCIIRPTVGPTHRGPALGGNDKMF